MQLQIVKYRVCNFPMKFSDREIAREIKFPDRESREIGKDLCTCPEILFFSGHLEPGTYIEITFNLALQQKLYQ